MQHLHCPPCDTLTLHTHPCASSSNLTIVTTLPNLPPCHAMPCHASMTWVTSPPSRQESPPVVHRCTPMHTSSYAAGPQALATTQSNPTRPSQRQDQQTNHHTAPPARAAACAPPTHSITRVVQVAAGTNSLDVKSVQFASVHWPRTQPQR